MELINDPQGFTKKLLGTLRHSSERFEVKLMCANLVSRMISCHKLLVLNFYPFMQKYIQPHHQHLTIILAIVAQSSHDLVPPDALMPIINTLANTFVSEHYAEEIIAIGLNTIREICARQPLAMDAETLHSLLRLKKSHHKGITAACRSIIGLYREANPHLLPKADRGKFADMSMVPREYGEEILATGVEGAELLESSDEEEPEEQDEDEEEDEEEGDEHQVDELEPLVSEEEKKFTGLVIIEDVEEEDGTDEFAEEEEDDSNVDERADYKQSSTKLGRKRYLPDSATVIPSASQPTKRQKIDTQRILTDEDFAKIRRKQGDYEDEERLLVEDGDVQAIVDPTDIAGYQRKRMTKEERREYIDQMKDPKQKFGFRQKKTGGKSNKEKLKNTPFMLAKQSANVRAKNKMSIKQKMAKRKRRGKPRRNGQPR
eukprot:TRINITY_DN3217_c0_g1_i3.p1 TRINITY_DN3217_c0_g1~~TRINITY_DN3217_c0_g1_i3.p1  ORF type:complete len:430 (+),score=98.30 TRINITY_DN3217_c0_g1_i3:972-2261(+)